MSRPGKVPDWVIAKEKNLSVTTIRRRRVKAGIPAYRDKPVDWTKIDPDLFVKSCRVLAREHGVSAQSISNRRRKLRRGV